MKRRWNGRIGDAARASGRYLRTPVFKAACGPAGHRAGGRSLGGLLILAGAIVAVLDVASLKTEVWAVEKRDRPRIFSGSVLFLHRRGPPEPGDA